MKWSPDQISNTLYDEGVLDISHETIYKHIWLDLYKGGNLYTHLRQSQNNAESVITPMIRGEY